MKLRQETWDRLNREMSEKRTKSGDAMSGQKKKGSD